MHGAGSPQTQRIMISRQGNIEYKKKLLKKLPESKTDITSPPINNLS
ncbi:MAG: 4-hydroxyphenylacetate 3-hydroxylase C-terminal domain-containing protein [Smithella sp.]|nr:4-hydroxyphenylacetate 3-hydroxylase C-terminal domain-containing protein [Smithella sp.]